MAHTTSGILFAPFRLDVGGPTLWKDGEQVALQPRPLAVLAYLATRPGVVVSRDELIATLWSGTYVTKAVLKVAIRAIREAIGDDADAPRYVETVGREGYRFIGAEAAPSAPPEGAPARERSAIVGREPELARLQAGLARARDGTRAMLFVTGDAGIGKTTLVDRFVAEVERAGGVRLVRGQCLEQYGEGEAYLPILEALGALARDDAAGEFRDTLARHAPTWLPHLAALDAPAAMPSRAGDASAAMPARMLRELADALEVWTRQRPLVLVLEDLQWSDHASVDLLGCIARRRAPAQLLVVGTLRPVDVKIHDHPLLGVLQDLRSRELCDEVALELLSRDDVAAYVAARFGGLPEAALLRLAARIHERTEGNGLFMVNMVNDLIAAGLLARREGQWHVDGSIDTATDRIPAGLQELLGRRMRGLAPAVRRTLEAASAAGDEFAVAAVAAAAAADPEQVEDTCELAAQGALLVEDGLAEWPDGTVSGRYRFRHALYRRALYEEIAEARRVRMHRAIGRRLEAGFASRAGEHAAELATQFALGRAHPRALRFHELAAAAALDRHAPHEALAHWSAALEALGHMPARPERAPRELALTLARATVLMAIQGYGAPATEQAFARARALCDALPAGPQRYPVLRGLISYHQVRAQFDEALALGEQLLRHADEDPDDEVLRVQAHYGAGTTLFYVGALGDARTHLETALREYDPATHRQHILVYGGYDPGVACALWLAWTLTMQGDVEAAATHARNGLALARRHGESFSLAWAHYAVAISQQLVGDWSASVTSSAEAERLAEEHGFSYVLGMARVNHGWALVMVGDPAAGIPLLRDGVARVDQTGAALARPSYLGMLATAHVLEGDQPSAVALVDEALDAMDRTGERVREATLLLGKANLVAGGDARRTSSRPASAAAEACLQRALDVARAQGARLLELRAAAALAGRWRERGRTAEARAVLDGAYAWFAKRPAAAPEIAAARDLLTALAAGAPS